MAGGEAEATIVTKVVKDLLGDAAEGVERDVARDGAERVAKDAAETGGRDAAERATQDVGRRGARESAEAGEDTAKEAAGRDVARDPVDVASGEMVLSQTDVDLPAVLRLVLRRTHVSSYRTGRWFGPSWASTLDQRLEIDERGACFVGEDGLILVYPVPMFGADSLPERGPSRPLSFGERGYTVTDPYLGQTLDFAPQANAGIPGGRAAVLPLAAITDRNGNRIELRYGDDGMLTEVCHSGGYRVGVETAGGRITAFRLLSAEERPLLKEFRYDEQGRLTQVAESSARATRFAYDRDGRITRWEDSNGCWYRYSYDDRGRVVRTDGVNGRLSGTFEYGHRTTVVTDSLGARTTYHLNEFGKIASLADPLGNTTWFEWDGRNRLLARTDALDRTTRFEYDEQGDLTVIRRPDGAQITIAYDGSRLPVQITDADGAVWRHEYDERGNRTAVTDPTGATTRYAYGPAGHLAAVADPVGVTTRVVADSRGLPVAVTDGLGHTTRYRRDAYGRASTVTDPLGGETRIGWTAEGRVAWRSLPSGATERWTYDGEGNLTEHVDASGKTTHTEFGDFDLPVAQTGPDGARFEFAYDGELRRVAVTNPNGLVWRYEYDSAGRLARETDFNGRVLSYTYDRAGQLVGRNGGVGATTRYVRDVLGNVVERRSEHEVAAFAYDPVGRIMRATNADADLRFHHDALGHVVAESCNGRLLETAFDAAGHRVWRRTPSGAESRWEYDRTHLPVALHTAGESLRFHYDAAGREVQRRIGTGTVLDQRWDEDHRLSSQTLWGAPRPQGVSPAPGPDGQARLLEHRAYAYRPDGSVRGIADRLAGVRHFDVDIDGRVIGVRGNRWTEQYAYDAAGNITTASWPSDVRTSDPAEAGIGERAYDGDRIRQAGGIRYEYDAEGRVILRQRKRLSAKPDTWRFFWNADDRLGSVVTPDGHVWRYRYDPLGRRIGKERFTPDGRLLIEQTVFTWDGPLLVEQCQTGSQPGAPARVTAWNYQPGSFRPVTQTERAPLRNAPQEWIDERFQAIVTDLVGAPTEMLDPAGDITWRATATLWGVTSVAGHSTDCRLRFPGQYHDAETGLNYNYHRYYDPTVGRYQSADPLGLAPAPDPYAYVSDPQHFIDPLGLTPCPPSSRAADFEVASNGEARDVRGLGRPDNQTVFSGHGSYDPANGTLNVPPGTSISVYAPHGATISDELGGAIETGTQSGRIPFVRTYNPGNTMPNYTLHPPYNPTLNIQGHPITVTADTNLSSLLRPNMGSTHWAACLEEAGHPLQSLMVGLIP